MLHILRELVQKTSTTHPYINEKHLGVPDIDHVV
jgi:hypothetical protein